RKRVAWTRSDSLGLSRRDSSAIERLRFRVGGALRAPNPDELYYTNILACWRLDLVDARANGGFVGFATCGPAPVELDELLPFGRYGALLEDGVHWTFGLAGAAVDALIWMDVELAIQVVRFDVDARDGAHVDARL